MNAKEQALAEIVALAGTHRITLDEITAALGRQQVEANKKDAFTLTRSFSYLGGIFILSGLGSYISVVWPHLNSAARVLITLGPGVICLILAVVSALQGKPGKNVTTLLLLSALFQPTGLFVALDEFVPHSGDYRGAAAMVFGVMALQYGMVFLKLKRTAPLFFTIYFAAGAFVEICDLMHIPYDLIECVTGASLVALSYGIQRTPYNSICGIGYFIGSTALLWMGFDLLRHTPLEVLYLGVAGFMLYVSTLVRSRSMLMTSALAIFSYISYFTEEHFMHSAGWPICMMLLGGIFLGLSNLALKLNKRLAPA